MTAGTQAALVVPRRVLAAAVAPLLLLAACQTGSPSPIVYTAPPEVLARTFPPAPPSASSPGAAPVGSPGPVGSLPPVGLGTERPSPAASAVGRATRGRVVFGTAAGTDSCTVGNPSDVLLTSQPFFFAAFLSDQMDGTQAIVLHVTKDGETLVDHQQPADGRAFDCYRNTEPLGTMDPGFYRFQVLQGTTLEADGSVTVR